MIGSNLQKGYVIPAILLFFFVLITGCVTQKQKGDLTKAQRLYHNTTSRYNGYFNAKLLYEASVLALNTQYQDNYNKILPVYEYTEADDPKSVSEDLDNAIKKVSVVVSLHRDADWVDDCYLLMGKSQFLKQDYESAQEALEYMVAEFNPDAIAKKKARKKKNAKREADRSKKGKKAKKKASAKKKKKRKKSKKKASKKRKKAKSKKKKGKKDKTTEKVEAATKVVEAKEEAKEEPVVAEEPKKNYFLKHRPAYQEGVLWLAMTYVERENFLGAERLFTELEENPHLFADIQAQVAPAKAYYFLEQDKQEEAVAPLTEAITLADDKNEKARYAYILAQIHQEAGRSNEALASFEQAKKFSTNYEVEFSSELNVLKSSMRSGKITEAEAEKQLEKMLKEAKNNEYQDQIYFVLADIALQAGNRPKAIDYLASSLETNSVNKAQKGESHLLLANLYFEEEQYVDAKQNYDAALTTLSKNDDRYLEVKQLSESLTDIAKNIEIITLQDSLLAVSELSDKDKRKLAAKMKRKQAEEALAKTKENQPGGQAGKAGGAAIPKTLGAGNVRTGLTGNSNFFAYSEKSVKKGRRDFDRNWPGRTLEDNWRRSNKKSSSIGESLEDVSSYEEALTDEEVTKMLAGVPTTDKEKEKANELIMTALYELGTLYRDRLKKNERAVTTLEELNNRYPGSRHELDSWYFLYLAHSDLGNETKKKEYFDKIIEKYGNTVYARVLQDPDYLAKSQSKESKINEYYNETYALFTSGKYQEVKNRVAEVPRTFGGNNSHQPRFALLNAMSLGNLESKEVYINSLKEIITRYPNTDEEKRAKEILRLLGDRSIVDAGLLDPDKVEKANEIFKVEDDKVHYGIVVFNNKVNLTSVKSTISDYNRKNHKLDQLRISNIYLGSDTNRPLIIIRKFKNKTGAMKYYDGIMRDPSDYIKVKDEHTIFVVNQFNYREILRNKSAVEYGTFFAKHYLEK